MNTHGTSHGQFAYFPFATEQSRLLPEKYEVVVNRFSGETTLVNWGTESFLVQMRFSDQELPLLLMMMERWPSYVPYEMLLSLITEEEVDSNELAHQIAEARERNEAKLDEICIPLRAILRECRDRLHLLGLDIAAVYQHSYLFVKRHAFTRQTSKEIFGE
jgi:hypothetical protein